MGLSSGFALDGRRAKHSVVERALFEGQIGILPKEEILSYDIERQQAVITKRTTEEAEKHGSRPEFCVVSPRLKSCSELALHNFFTMWFFIEEELRSRLTEI